MSTPTVYYPSLEDGFIYPGYEDYCWIDKRTGDTLFLESEIVGLIESGADMKKIPEWQRELVKHARRVMRSLGELPHEDEDLDRGTDGAQRYVRVPKDEPRDVYQDMMDFARFVASPLVSEALLKALRGDSPFRHFEDTVRFFPLQEDLWRAFSERRLRQRIERWAREEGIEIIYPEEHWPRRRSRLIERSYFFEQSQVAETARPGPEDAEPEAGGRPA